MHLRRRTPARLARRLGVLAATLSLGVAALSAAPAPAYADNVVTPGDFTGYGFDQCLAPTQKSMNKWMKSSPFLAAGIYISGNSRACREQPNLTPEWVTTQLAKGWRLLPITLGPQSTCVGRFPRYGASIDPTIINGNAAAARAQGNAEADSAVAAAAGLGISPGSTLWYDLEGWSNFRDATCRESALAFLTGWTERVRAHGYVSGVYSSAGSGMKILDDARVQRRTDVILPDRIWIARWDGVANTSTSYIAEDGWRPGGRVKQYQGGHDETWGGVTINIDRNYLELGAGSVAAPETHCGGTNVDLPKYKVVKADSDPALVAAWQCLLGEQAPGRVKPLKRRTLPPAATAWLTANGFKVTSTWKRKHWVALLSAGTRPVQKVGSAGEATRRIQRALNAAGNHQLGITGVYDAPTEAAVKTWQARVGIRASGIVAPNSWKRLQQGKRR